jgi:hypothetical protein
VVDQHLKPADVLLILKMAQKFQGDLNRLLIKLKKIEKYCSYKISLTNILNLKPNKFETYNASFLFTEKTLLRMRKQFVFFSIE